MDEKARQLLQTLGITGPQTVIATGEFTGGGFIGQCVAAHLYRVNIEGPEQPIQGVATTSPMGEWGFAYYFREQEVANAAAKLAQLQYARSSAVWRVEVPTRSVITKAETMAKLLGQGDSRGFGEIITGEVAVRTLTSKKYRHEWQLIAFPCLVSAAARLLGKDVEPFDISELRDQQTVFTDELFARLCGNPDAKKDDEDFYTQSTYWKQRAALWAALGEPDPAKCHTMSMNTKFSTESDDLDVCIQVALTAWTNPIWGRFRLVADPRVDAVSNDRRLNLGVITDLYATEAAAREAANVEGDAEGTATTVQGGPAVPETYVAAGFNPDMFADEIKRTASKPVPLAAKELDVDSSIVGAWREHLGL